MTTDGLLGSANTRLMEAQFDLVRICWCSGYQDLSSMKAYSNLSNNRGERRQDTLQSLHCEPTQTPSEDARRIDISSPEKKKRRSDLDRNSNSAGRELSPQPMQL